jgi:Na+/H+ antiporter NhaC
VLGLESVVGKGGYAPDVSSFTGIGELDCGARIVVSTAVAGAPLDPWSATAVLYQTFEVVEDEIKEMLCVS